MRSPAGWSEVCIVNISPRGLQLQSAEPPPRGAFLEVRRGSHTIIATVAWAKQHRFGVRTQDTLPVDEIIAGVTAAVAPSNDTGSAERIERRSQPRPSGERHETNRRRARAMEFACAILFGLGAGTIAFEAVADLFARPLAAAEVAWAGEAAGQASAR
jgi:hypothetical protein